MTPEQEQSLVIIEHAPLVSIDLIVYDASQHILVGKRNNRPAKNFWFVPGGRIRKNERQQDALRRISEQELGIALNFNDGQLLGAYDHVYDDNYVNHPGINTHYVALGYAFHLSQRPEIQVDEQHSDIRWLSKETLLQSSEVHANTKVYLIDPRR